MGNPVPRTLPDVEPHTEAFWTGGQVRPADDQPVPELPAVRSPPRAHVPLLPQQRRCCDRSVSGKATVVSYTVNHMPWVPDLPVPYVFAAVELDEQPGLRLSTEIVNIDPEAVFIGMSVKVVFEQQEEIYLPLFEPQLP